MKTFYVTLFTGLVASLLMLSASADIRSACAEDIKTLCSGVQPGGGRIKACMKEHKDQLSDACKQALIEKAKEKDSQ